MCLYCEAGLVWGIREVTSGLVRVFRIKKLLHFPMSPKTEADYANVNSCLLSEFGNNFAL